MKAWILRLLGISLFEVRRVGQVALIKVNGKLSHDEMVAFKAAFPQAFPSELSKAGFKVGDSVMFQPYPDGTPKKEAKIDCDCTAHGGISGWVHVRWSDEIVRDERLALGYHEPGTAYAEIAKLEAVAS